VQQQIETIVADSFTRFTQDYLGRRPKRIDTHLLGDLLIIRIQGALAAAEQQVAERGRDLVKQVRAKLIEATRPILETLVKETTGSKVVSLHHDVSTVTGEEVVVFTLANAPRETTASAQ
jgi:uncharacterized protein YbcI